MKRLSCNRCGVDIGEAREKSGRQREFCEPCKKDKIKEKGKRPRKWAKQRLSETKSKLELWITEFVESADPALSPLQCAVRFRDAVESAFK